MEMFVRNVRDLAQSDRTALERVVGQQLRETQRVIVNVENIDSASPKDTATANATDVPEWWNVYEGLSDEEVDRLDAVVRQRADLTRSFE